MALAENTAVLFTKVISGPEGLCIRGALDLGVVGLAIGGIALISPRLKSAAFNGLEKTATIHAMENPLHAFAGAVFTGVGIAMTVDSFQSFIAAVQNWYGVPPNPKAVSN